MVRHISIVLAILGVALIAWSLLQRNSNFLDIRSVFKQHFRIFKGNSLQLASIFVVPTFFAFAITQEHHVDKYVLNNLNIVLSILISMFFAILSILCAFGSKEQNNTNYTQLLKETFNATIFEATICIIVLFISFTKLFIGEIEQTVILQIISGIIYYLAIVAVLNIFVVIKRLKVLFDNKSS